jgi:hypothetical protein
MTTREIPLRQHNHSLRPYLLVLLVTLAAFLFAVSISSHAFLTHGSVAMKAADCFNGKGTIQPTLFVCPDNGRTFEVCKGFDGFWYVMINGCDGKNITCFPRSAAKCFSDVASYARRSGFTFPYP